MHSVQEDAETDYGSNASSPRGTVDDTGITTPGSPTLQKGDQKIDVDASDDEHSLENIDAKAHVTYKKPKGRSKSKSVSREPDHDLELPDSTEVDGDDAIDRRTAMEAPMQSVETGEAPLTSEPPGTQGVADEAATRSMKKRKAHDVECEDDDELLEPKAKASGLRKAAASDEAEETPSRRGKLPIIKSQRSDVETTDEIFIAQRAIKAMPSTPLPPKSSPRKSSPSVVVPPSSSVRPSSTPLVGKVPKLLLSGTPFGKDTKRIDWLKKQGAQVVEKVPNARTYFVCVVPSGKLHTTAKVLHSLALDKAVVTEAWVAASVKAGELLQFEDYQHDDLLSTAAYDRSRLFKGKMLFFTKQLKQEYGGTGWKDIETLATEVGASRIEFGVARKLADMKGGRNAVVFASKDDEELAQLLNDGRVVFHKDMFVQSILRGEVDLEGDAFHLEVSKKSAGNAKAKAKAKKR